MNILGLGLTCGKKCWLDIWGANVRGNKAPITGVFYSAENALISPAFASYHKLPKSSNCRKLLKLKITVSAFYIHTSWRRTTLWNWACFCIDSSSAQPSEFRTATIASTWTQTLLLTGTERVLSTRYIPRNLYYTVYHHQTQPMDSIQAMEQKEPIQGTVNSLTPFSVWGFERTLRIGINVVWSTQTA